VKTAPLVDVTGMPADRAMQLLDDAKYAVRVVEQSDNEYPPGTVLAQEPAAHAPVTQGSAITIVVARAPDRATVPTVLGLLSDEASFAAGAKGLQLRIVQQAEPPPGSPARAGRIWKQSPVGGTVADEGDTVTVWVNP
jgi:serine/threonine-protein kinase